MESRSEKDPARNHSLFIDRQHENPAEKSGMHMIISASRRTGIPAFYAEWFMNRIRAGYCMVPNPFNPAQVSRVPLTPDNVDVVVFWTRYPRPLFRHFEELESRGYR
jgi:hypothetical protein